jgi:VIT1/CCC1 family predicted Fe2+/Mn2+ transporter
MNHIVDKAMHTFASHQYQKWSRFGGFLVGNGVAYAMIQNVFSIDSNGKRQKMTWRDVYTSSLLHLGFSILGFMTGPVLPIVPILLTPGLLYKLADPVPSQKVTPKLQ